MRLYLMFWQRIHMARDFPRKLNCGRAPGPLPSEERTVEMIPRDFYLTARTRIWS